MLKELVIRVLVGGTIVSSFALLSDLLQPKRFAGLFGAAPSIALATLSLTIITEGKLYAAQEARSMAAGAIAFFVYALAVMQVLFRLKTPPLVATCALLVGWFGVAFSMWALYLR